MAILRSMWALLGFVVAVLAATRAMADPAKDRADCSEQLVELATCLPYVRGQAKAPTPDCCNGLKQVLKSNKKCLCVIVRDRDDPDLSLQINVTLALSLPTVCDSPANVSKCPELLNMDPKSPEAQVFYQLKSNNSAPSTNGPTPSPIAGGPTSAKSQGVSASGGGGEERLGWSAIVATFMLLSVVDLKWFL